MVTGDVAGGGAWQWGVAEEEHGTWMGVAVGGEGQGDGDGTGRV